MKNKAALLPCKLNCREEWLKKEKNHEKNSKFIVTGCIPDLWHRSECSISQHQ
jgi:hypothetical protein